jgi:hypothetical protein
MVGDQYCSLYSLQHTHYSLTQIFGWFIMCVDSNELEKYYLLGCDTV